MHESVQQARGCALLFFEVGVILSILLRREGGTVALWELLEIPPGITALIGSGGKSTLLSLLARELSAAGERVLCATTTHMFPPEGMSLASSPAAAEALLSKGGPVCIGARAETGKLGPPPEDLAVYQRLCDHLLVEADGSRRLPLKAHAPHEPVIPAGTARTVLVVGASGLYRPVWEAVHRPEIFCTLADCAMEDPATPERVARVIQKEGLGDLVLVNQADAAREAAEELAALVGKPAVTAALQKGVWSHVGCDTGSR